MRIDETTCTVEAEAVRSRRVTMVSARYPPFVGGTETHVAEVSRLLVQRGYEIDVITTVLDRDAVGISDEGGVRVVRVLAGPKASDLHLAPEILRIIRRSQSDLVHVQGYHTLVAPIAMASAIAAKLPFVVTFHSGGHSSQLRRMIRPVQHRLLKTMLRRSRRLIGVSDYETTMFREILRLPDELFVTVTNGVSSQFTDQDVDTGAREPIVLSVGRLESYKRHGIAIAAISRVRHEIPGVRLRIVGDGPEIGHLRQLAREHYVGDIVEFTSLEARDRRGMATTMSSAAVVSLMSRYESQGIVGLEALASGCRLIVAGGSALEELRKYDATTVLDDVHAASLADALVARLRETAPHVPAGVPTWEDTTSALERTYRAVLDWQ